MPLGLDELKALAAEGSLDTVIVALTDMQGRLQGKRCSARYFLDEVVPNAVEACTYLLAVDVEMQTVGGYSMSSWERGYGDFVMRPDLATLRTLPWAPVLLLYCATLNGMTAPRSHRRPDRSLNGSSPVWRNGGSSPTWAPNSSS